MRVRQGERGRRVGEVAHLGSEARLVRVRQSLLENADLRGDRRMTGLVRAGEVRPDAGDLEQALGLGLEAVLDELGPVGGLPAVPPESRVDLELDPGPATRRLRRGDDLAQGPHATDRDIDIRLDRGPPGPARRPQPAQHPRVVEADPGGAQGQRLLRRRGAHPGRARLNRGLGAGHHPVAVPVGLDHGHECGPRRPGTQSSHIGAQRGQIDLRADAQGARRSSGQSLRGL